MEDENENAVVIRGRGQGANSQRKRGVKKSGVPKVGQPDELECDPGNRVQK